MIIPGYRGYGLDQGIWYKPQLADVGTNYLVGAGSEYPLPASLPISQIARYWWVPKSWRIQVGISFTDTPGPLELTVFSNLDTGFIPYGKGIDFNGDPVDRNWGLGNKSIAPNPWERYQPISFNLFTEFFGPNNVFWPITTDDQGDPPFRGPQINIYLLSSLPITSATIPPGAPFYPPVILDPSTSGAGFMNVIVQIIGWYANIRMFSDGLIYNLQSGGVAGMAVSPITASLDGMAFPMYWNPASFGGTFSMGGSIAITTRDT